MGNNDFGGEANYGLPVVVPYAANDEPTTDTIDFSFWEALCYEIALGLRSEEQILAEYGVSDEALAKLRANPSFVKMLETKRGEVEKLGGDASHIIQYRIVAGTAIPELQRRLLDRTTSNKDFLTLLAKVIEVARLLPQKDERADTGGGGGLTVIFNSSGVPGLEHLSAKADDVLDMTVAEVGKTEKALNHGHIQDHGHDPIYDLPELSAL